MNDKKRKRLANIREQAFQAFIEYGFEAQMSDIARSCKIGHGTLYRDFKDKDALYDHILQLEIERAEAQWQSDTLASFTQSLLSSWIRPAPLFAHVPKSKLSPLQKHYARTDALALPLLNENVRLWRACVFQSALEGASGPQSERIVALFGEGRRPPPKSGAVQGWKT